MNPDAALFRAQLGDVIPLPEQNRISPPPPRVNARVRPRPSGSDLIDSLSDHGSAPEEHLKNGVSRLTLKKLKRGMAQDNLDLHGYQSDEARRLLQGFLQMAQERGLRTVLVIHGKGYNSPNNEAVLRELTRNWLSQHPRVLAYCQAPLNLGGSGAVLVHLKA